MSYYQLKNQVLTLDLHVQPGASRTECSGLHGGRLKIRLAAPASEGRANEALIAFLASELGVPRRNVRIEGGASSRRKRVVVDGVKEELPWKMPTS